MRSALTNIDWSQWLQEAIKHAEPLGLALVVFLVGIWVAARIANFGLRAMKRAKLDATLLSFLRNLIYGVLIVVVIVAALGQAGVPTASFVAVIGAAGLAVGLSLQGSLSNLAWGVLLITFRPFKVGDFVEVGGMLGTVERIDLMQTWLTMPDGRDAIIPNSKVGGDAVINFNRRGTRRFELNVGIGYGDDIDRALAAVRALFEADKRILTDPAPGVWMNQLGDSSCNLVIRAWTQVPDFWETQMALLKAIKERFDAEGISIPFPQREVLMRQIDAPTAAAAGSA
jgi:small conductance mechanosensitive channel